jgi:DNA-binding Lrp family transcriptional regulator
MAKLDYKVFDMLSKVDLNGTQYKIVMAVIYHMRDNPSRDFPYSELTKIINTSKRQVSKEMKKLFDDKILIEVLPPTHTTARVIDINRNYSEWKIRDIEKEIRLKLVSNDYSVGVGL